MYIPDKLELSRQMQIAEVPLLLSNEPRLHFGSGKSTAKITLDLSAQSNKAEVITVARQIEAYCTYNKGRGTTPSLISVSYGKIFAPYELWAVKSFSPDYQYIDGNTGEPRMAKITLDLMRVLSVPISQDDVLYK